MADTLAQFEFDRPGNKENLASLVVRLNFNSLGTTNFTTDANYPQNPQVGMLRIFDAAGAGTNILLQWYYGGSWVTLLEHLEIAGTFARRFEFLFAAAANPWTITHNLGVRPIVQCFDAADSLIVPVDIQQVQVLGQWARVVVTHGGPQTGFAILVG